MGLQQVSLTELAAQSGLPEHRVKEGLHYLEKTGLLEEVVAEGLMMISLQQARTRKPYLGVDRVRKLRRRAASRMEDVIAYASGRDCRRRILRNYFGEKAPARCGACDNCLGRHRRSD
jgi:ATP-dependent DNA helicase RecQ